MGNVKKTKTNNGFPRTVSVRDMARSDEEHSGTYEERRGEAADILASRKKNFKCDDLGHCLKSIELREESSQHIV